MRAQDSGSPRLFDTEVVYVTVNRNLNTPEFLQSQYISSILETTTPGTSILQVQARDTDISVRVQLLDIKHKIYSSKTTPKIWMDLAFWDCLQKKNPCYSKIIVIIVEAKTALLWLFKMVVICRQANRFNGACNSSYLCESYRMFSSVLTVSFTSR